MQQPSLTTFKALALALLGAHAWASLVGIPIFTASVLEKTHVLASSVPLLVLAVGVLRSSRIFLLGVYPAVLALTAFACPPVADGLSHTRLTAIIATAAILAYTLTTAWVFSTHHPVQGRRRRMDAHTAKDREGEWKRLHRLVIAGSISVGGGSLAAISLLLLPASAWQKWHDAYPDGVAPLACLSAVAALFVWTPVSFRLVSRGLRRVTIGRSGGEIIPRHHADISNLTRIAAGLSLAATIAVLIALTIA